MTAWNTFFEEDLASLASRGLLRDLHTLPETGEEISVEGRRMLNFSSNDYLGLAGDRRLKDAAKEAVEKFGCGATASRLMAGNLELHELLERDLAAMVGKEAALVFGSGYLTNLGVLSALGGPGDAIFSDWLNHASLIDGIRLSRARCYRYRHKDMDHLETLLKRSKPTGKRIIVSESLFSMDGDLAPLSDLSRLAHLYDALLVIDEAHAIGVLGASGGGVCRSAGSEVSPQIVIGTLSKALGGYGGFVACSQTIRRLLINKARSFIFSTGLPPGCLGGGREAVSIVVSNPELGRTLIAKSQGFSRLLAEYGLKAPQCESQILPVLVGDNEAALRLSGLLWGKGLLVRAVRPPTVPDGTARIRLSVTLTMADSALERAAGIIAEAAEEIGVV
ncbi:MAG: 8-amino-7-oxononanoate synthase [Dehalococcoidia bacterium]|nr:8-amino-7-oxononanoate synthase [Dehalococcoidia bacterium]